MELNLEQYTREFLNKKEMNTRKSSITDEEQLIFDFQATPNYYMYKLCGVVVHSGTADSGHYVSVAVDRESSLQWYEFNDSKVTKFNPDLMQVETFGGNERPTHSGCGYMLIYERINYFHMPTIRELFEKADEMKDGEKVKAEFENALINYDTLLNVKVSEDIEKRLVSENAKYRQIKVILNPDYIKTINSLLTYSTLYNTEEPNLNKSINLQQFSLTLHTDDSLDKLQFFAIYFFTIMLRVTLRTEYYSLLEILTTTASKHLPFSVWLLESFTHPDIIQEFLIGCPIPKARFTVASLLDAAFTTVFNYEHKRITKYINNPKLFNEKLNKKGELKGEEYRLDKGLPYSLLFIHNLVVKVSKVLENRRSMFEYFFLLSSICRKQPILIQFLLEYGMLGVVFEILLENSGPSIEAIKAYKPIIINKELSLGFQKADTNSDPNRGLIASRMTRIKHYRFAVEFFSIVT